MKNKMKREKILFIAPSPMYLEKGSSLRMYAIAENLSKKYDLDLVTYSTGKEFSLKNTKIYRTPKWFKPALGVGKPSFSKIILDFFILMKSLKLICFNKYKIIHCEDFEGASIGYFLSFFSRARLVYDLHNRILDNLGLKTKIGILKYPLAWIEKLIINRCDLIILNWAKYKDHLIFKNKNKFVYYDKIDTSIKKYPLPYKDYIIYTGNFEKYQGIKEFLDVFKEIKTDIKLVLVGQPNEEVTTFIKENNLNNRVILTGRLSISETNYLIKNSLFGIVPRIEGSSMKVVHYFLWNKPVLATNTSSNKELIKNNSNGWLYNSDKELKYLLKTLDIKKIDKVKKGVEKIRRYIIKIWEVNNFLKEYEK